jgi:hypothetical protein
MSGYMNLSGDVEPIWPVLPGADAEKSLSGTQREL